MDGTVPVWLFVSCLAVAAASGFTAGFYWSRYVVRRRLRREVARARARFAERERVPAGGYPRQAGPADAVDTTRFTL